ncbi:hypothetical protein GCM10010435_87260 [Winogradskya consettensis]|uniref:Protein kinase domain-containing protein n=1 Tax=Winogradskya consettensis TaxID=113560 RepID=A0A919T0Z7_9ACTN|nr:serine/threonine-protein kinase [Actinoplanes consettensis]GIM80858.1 hypothetical protein Aco04nite_73170 [Actinoplanes consettensis]
MSTNAPIGRLTNYDPRRAGRYRLVGRLGRGGQGTVYLGEDEDGGFAAVKVLNVDVRLDARARERFLREIAAARQVASFCTAQILDVDVDGDPPYVASEFIEGRNLGDEVTRHGPLHGTRLERMAISTITALAAIHQAGVVHCDFKPGNVVCGPDGARVIDFGIARAAGDAGHSTVVGSPSYMSPERYANAGVGPPADVFAWAATVAYAASGEPPFGTDSMPAIMNRVLNEAPRLPGLGSALDELLRDCLRKDPGARPQAREALLRLVEGGGPVQDPRLAESVQLVTQVVPREEPRNHRDVAGIVLAVVMGAAGALAGYQVTHEVPPAAILGGAALAATYLVRTMLAGRESARVP